MSLNIDKVIEEAKLWDQRFTKKKIQFPISYVNTNTNDQPIFRSNNSEEFLFHPGRIGVLSELNRTYKWMDYRKLWDAKNYQGLCDFVNHAIRERRKNPNAFFTAIEFDGLIINVVTNIAHIEDAEILAMLPLELQQSIRYYEMDWKESYYDFLGEELYDQCYSGIRITNSLSGNASLELSAIVRDRDIVYQKVLDAANHFVGSIPRTKLPNFYGAWKDVRDFELKKGLLQFSEKQFIKEILELYDREPTRKDHKLLYFLQNTRTGDGLHGMQLLTNLGNSPTYVESARRILHPLLEEYFGSLLKYSREEI